MDTSEALDLSKENIQPLKQGRNAVKLGTALQAQTNTEVQQKLHAEREQFELLIRMYDGDDPLKPHYDYFNWTEQIFPKHGPDSNIGTILEHALTTFREDERYKQDLRYAELLIKYIDMQPNPVEIFQIVYDQGLCTMCAPFYIAWADELDKNDDIKLADQIFELGIRVQAQPLELLKEAHLRFQLSVGRRLLGRQEESNEAEMEHNRQALHKLQKKNVHGVRNPIGAPGQVKQQGLGNRHNQNNVPFKVYEGDQKDSNSYHGDGHGKIFPKQHVVNKENSLKAGPWSQNGGKLRSRGLQPSSASKPTFQVHEDEGADLGNGHHKTSSVPRALKPRKLDDFTCPLAVFEPPDPSKRPMYCKNKVYAGGREFQFEELRAAIYNRHYNQLAAQKLQEESIVEEKSAAEGECEIPNTKLEVLYEKKDEEIKPASDSESVTEEKNQYIFSEHTPEKVGVEEKSAPLEANTSLFHSQSFTVNTKEAMNVVQEMWHSPSPASSLRGTNAYPASPAGLDESGLFKVPGLPPSFGRLDGAKTPTKIPKSAVKNTPSFPIYSDDEPIPPPESTPSQPFKIYSDDADPDQPQPIAGVNKVVESGKLESAESKENTPFQFHCPTSNKAYLPENDPATLKMLAFDSDSEGSDDGLPAVVKIKAETNQRPVNQLITERIPGIALTAPTPDENKRRTFDAGPIHHPIFQDEDRFEDMTCNTKSFDFVLPSSTPLVSHFQPLNSQTGKNNNNGSFISEDVKKNVTKQELSILFEASKERYSSSSGSSNSKTQGSVCTAANLSTQMAQQEVMEKLAQISINKSDLERSFALLNVSGPIDPFSIELISQLLIHIGYPKKHHLIGLQRFDVDAPALHTNSTVKLGSSKYSVIGELGKGNYARVLKATRDGQPVALKQQRPGWEWEWYIVQELQSRLPPNKMGGFLHMSNGYIFRNASILESEWAQFGSILSVVNKLKISGKGQDLHLAVLFSIQLTSIVEHLHKCKIIHGDIKPDNFVLSSIPKADNSELCLKLIDFGRSIDMTLLPEDTTFTTVVTTDGFQCNEMKEGRPWTYQTDLYGLAGSIYCVLFYDYMKVIKKDNKWQLSNKIPRYMKPALWQDIFSSLLNVESCDKLPNLVDLQAKLEESFKAMDSSTVMQSITKLSNVLLNK